MTNTFLNALAFVPQQVTRLGQGVLALEPVNSGETGLISLILGLEFSVFFSYECDSGGYCEEC